MTERKSIHERIEILEKSGLITELTAVRTRRILELLDERESEMDGEKLEMFITHMAMALQRTWDGRCEIPLDRAVLEELRSDGAYPEAKSFVRRLEETVDVRLPEEEKEYILVHLCNLFS